MDLNDVEAIDLNALGGADTITVNDLSRHRRHRGQLEPRRHARRHAGDGQPTRSIVNGTNGDDVVVVTGDATGTSRVRPGRPGERHRRRGGQRPADRQRASPATTSSTPPALAAGAIQLTADGGDGDDVLIGGAGNDMLLGGAGDDVLSAAPAPTSSTAAPATTS